MQAWRSFGDAAEAYELGRSEWPAEVAAVGDVPESATVLDLAAGTGKLTRLLVRRFTRVIAVEPIDEMRAILERVVPEAEALPGTADAIPVADAAVDAVYVAEAFHWFGGDAEAVAEIARVLRPGGALVLVWSERRGAVEPALPDAFRERAREARKRAAWPYGDEGWRPALEAGPFGPIHEHRFATEHVHTRETMLALAASWSWIASLPQPERERELEALGETLPEGTWTFPVYAHVYWTRRNDTRAPGFVAQSSHARHQHDRSSSVT